MKVEHIVPILNVSDVEASFAWFAKLGWDKQFEWYAEDSATPPDFGGVSCDGYEMFLCRDGQGSRRRGDNAETGGAGANERADKGAWVSMWVDDIDRVHKRCLSERLDITHPPTDEPWRVREMHVRDPDGHVFRIGRARGDTTA